MDFFSMIGGGLWFIFTIWALVNILTSGASTGHKILWVLLVLILPVLGPILWILMGPKS